MSNAARALGAATLMLALLAVPAAASADFNVGDRIEVLWNGAWYLAKVQKKEPTRDKPYHVTYVEWAPKWDEWVGAKRTRAYKPYAVGDVIQVQWKRKYYKAKILKAEESRYFITYPGWDKKWNEWVTVKRIRRK